MTFNGRGKTDIYIPVDGSDGSVFIAECKIWKGPAGIGKAIDQLLVYLRWRDTKAALIVFHRSGSPAAVWVKITDGVRAHPSYKRDRGVEGTVFTLAADNDENREIHLAVLHVPVLGSAGSDSMWRRVRRPSGRTRLSCQWSQRRRSGAG